MTQLVLNIERPAVLPVLKRLIGIIDGVSIAKPVGKVNKASAESKDPTLMTKEEFYAMIDEAKEEVRQGKVGPVFDSAKDLIEYLKAR